MIIQCNFSSQLLLNYFSHLCIVACVTFLVAVYSATDELFIQRAWCTPNGFLDFIPNTNAKLKKWACTQVFAFIEMNWLFFAIYTYTSIYIYIYIRSFFHLRYFTCSRVIFRSKYSGLDRVRFFQPRKTTFRYICVTIIVYVSRVWCSVCP